MPNKHQRRRPSPNGFLLAQRWRGRSPHEFALYALEVADAPKLGSASFGLFNEPPEALEFVVTVFEIAGGVLQTFWVSIHGHSLTLTGLRNRATPTASLQAGS